MPVATIDDTTALIVVDLQKGIVNSPSIHPISGVIGHSCGEPGTTQEIIDLLAKRGSYQ